MRSSFVEDVLDEFNIHQLSELDLEQREVIYTRAQPHFERYVKKRYGRMKCYEDLAQEARIAVWEATSNFTTDGRNNENHIPVWSKSVAQKAANSFLRVELNPVFPHSTKKKIDAMEKLQAFYESRGITDLQTFLNLAGFREDEYLKLKRLAHESYLVSLDEPIGEEFGEDFAELKIDTIPSPVEDETALIIHDALDQIPWEESLLLVLQDMMQFSEKEIVAMDPLKRNRATLYRIRQRAIQSLRDVLYYEEGIRRKEREDQFS